MDTLRILKSSILVLMFRRWLNSEDDMKTMRMVLLRP